MKIWMLLHSLKRALLARPYMYLLTKMSLSTATNFELKG